MRVLVDTDPALLTLGLDVDDDLALLLLLGSPEVELAGVTVTFGNTSQGLAYHDARRLLALAGRPDIPVRRGASSRGDLSPSPAARFLVEAVNGRPGELTLLTLGPLTNLAAALQLDPELGGKLDRLVVMGGRAASGASEFNFRHDPEAAAAALALPCEKALIPFDLAFPVAVTPAHVERLCREPRSVVSLFEHRLGLFARFQDAFRALRGRAPGEAEGGFHPWDVVAAAWLVAPGLFSGVGARAHRVNGRGASEVGAPRPGEPVVRIPSRVDPEGLLELMMKRVPRVVATG